MQFIPDTKSTKTYARQRARRIIALAADDLIQHPSNKYIHSPPVATVLYQHIRIFASGFSELIDFNPREKLKAVESALINLWGAYHFGMAELRRTHGEVVDAMPVAQIIDYAIREKVAERNGLPVPYVLYFILALDELLDFVDNFTAAYRTKSELKSRQKNDDSYRGVVDALGSLCSAQMALHIGQNHMTLVLATGKLQELSKRAELSEQQLRTELTSGTARNKLIAKLPRQDDLNREIEKIVKANPDITCRLLIESLREKEGKGVIETVNDDEEQIEWSDKKHPAGLTSFSALKHRLSRVRSKTNLSL